MFQIPKHRTTTMAMAFAVYLTAPLVEWYYLRSQLIAEAFPVSADSISIPIAHFLVGWIVCLPFFVVLVVFATKGYPGNVPLLSLTSNFGLRGVVCSSICAIPIFYYLFFAVQSLQRHQFLDTIQAIAIVYVVLSMRAAFLMRKHLQLKAMKTS